MKKSILLLCLLSISSTNGAVVLLGGFQGTNDTAIQSSTATGITVTLTASTGDITPAGGSFQSNPATWGTQALDVAPSDTGNRQIVQSATTTAWWLELTITNNSGNDVILDSIHYWTKKDVNNEGPPSATFAYTAGNLGSATSTSIAIANGVNARDFALNTLLGDVTLADGESATFRWTTDAPQNPTGNTSLRIDNFAISGTIIPEPSTLLLGAFGSLLLLRRRRCA